MIKNNESGYALLEILLAFAVAAVIITGMVSLGVSSVRAVTTNRAYSEAGKIAQREVDRLKLLRDTYPPDAVVGQTSWQHFYNAVVKACGTGCYVDVSGATFTKSDGKGFSGVAPSKVTYWFKFTDAGVNNPARYEVNTTWSVGNITDKSYKIEGVLTNWKEI